MATLTFNYTSSEDNQIWLKGTGAAGQLWSPTISGIPSGATINSATLTFATGNTYSSPGRTDVYWGTSADVTSGANTRIWYVSGSGGGNSYSVDLKAYITGNMTANLYFYKTANSSSSQSNVYFTSIAITIDYTIPYTACTAPTSVTISKSSAGPGASVTLSWSGASAGTNNAITGYHVYRATSASGTYSHTYTVSTTSTSGSTSVTAPTTNGNAYYYKVYTIGTVSGYNSGASSYVSLTCSYSAPSAPTSVTINSGSSAYVAENGTATLAWSGASAGTNNPIAGYDIYVGGTLYSSQGSSVSSLSIPAYSAGSHTWTVRTKGSYSSSGDSTGVICYTYSKPTAPTTITVSNSTPDAGSTVTLSWSGAAAGTYNAITGYHVYRSDTASGTYSYLANVTTTATSGSCTVAAPSSEGASYYFKVYTLGARSNSSISGTYAKVVTKVVKPCVAPSSCLLSSALSHTAVTMSWSDGQSGENNPLTGYEVQRSESSDGKNWSGWETIATQTGKTLSVSPPGTYGHYYRYHVKTCGESLDSSWKDCTHTLRRDHQPIAAYTDSTLVVGETLVKAVHINELQSTILMLLDFYGLDAQSMSNVVSGQTGLSAWTTHVNEIRSAVDFLTTYHDSWLDIPVNCPRADVMQQLRDIIAATHKPKFVLGIGKAGAVVI